MGGRSASQRRATIVDVAELSGVSKSTVANVVRGDVRVSEETAARVRAAIAELGYVPNALARSLKQRRVATIGAVIGDLANPFYADLVKHVEHRIARDGYATIICDAVDTPTTERDRVAMLIEQRVAGVLLTYFSGDRGVIADLQTAGIPVVGLSVMDGRIDHVVTDDVRATQLAVEHLVALGHRRIVYVVGAGTEQSTIRARVQGWRSAMRLRGLPAGRIVTLGLESPPPGVTAVELDDAMSARRRPTAMIAQNDVTALELIDRLEAGGLRVPADVSVVGYDDIPAAGLDRISLTTLRQDTPRLVARAAELLMGRIEGTLPAGVSANLVPPQFVVRTSTGRCRDAA